MITVAVVIASDYTIGFKHYVGFILVAISLLLYPKQKPLPIKGITLDCSMFEKIAQKDYLQYAPYHTFAYTIKLCRQFQNTLPI